jgi:hypothetical protein
MKRRNGMRALKYVAPALTLALVILTGTACTKAPGPMKFATPEAAATTLLQALKNNDTERLGDIFGRDNLEAIASGDPVADRQDREIIAVAMEQSRRWAPLGEGRLELIIGEEQWPFAAPLVQEGSEWRFDSESAIQEVLARRVGRNELAVIGLCRAYLDFQQEYASQSHDGKPAGLFAQRIRSNPDREDGLYYPRKPGERPSPLGDLAAKAAQEGHDANQTEPIPFWGYQFRILTAQGDKAPGGRKSYLVNGEMSGGFALVAFPARYAASGVMTFIVNQDGVVYQKDLGPETEKLAAELTEFNPDDTWAVVNTGAENI